MSRSVLVISVLLALGATQAGMLALRAEEAVEAITKPIKDVTLSFVRPGRIAKVLVKEGDAVTAGAELVRQDDIAERIRLEQIDAEAKDTTRIDAAKAQVAQKKVELERKKKAEVPELEIDQVTLEVTIAQLSLQLAQFEHAQNARKCKEMEAEVDRMRITSPIAGKIEQVFVKEGESANALADVIRVVQIDPLLIDAPVPTELAKRLHCGQAAEVAFNDAKGKPIEGKITHIANVADAASDTLTVRVEVPNPTGRPAGEHVRVRFPVLDGAGKDGLGAPGGKASQK